MCQLRAVVGLGNPGTRYAGTRHNVGFRVVQELASRWRLCWLPQGSVQIARATSGILLVQPQTYMNRSGVAVHEVSASGALSPDELLVVYDDVDLALGRMRFRPSGGPGTHNGMRDIVAAVGDQLPRLRVGVAGSGADGVDLAEYVLSPFADDERRLAQQVVATACDAVEVALSQGLQSAMNRFNGLVIEADSPEDAASSDVE